MFVIDRNRFTSLHQYVRKSNLNTFLVSLIQNHVITSEGASISYHGFDTT